MHVITCFISDQIGFLLILSLKYFFCWDFPGGPVVKTFPSNAGGAGSFPGWGAKIPHASWPKNQTIKQKQYCNKFNTDFFKKMGDFKNIYFFC